VKHTLALVLIVFGIIGCGNGSYYTYTYETARVYHFQRANTPNEVRLNDFRNCKKDVALTVKSWDNYGRLMGLINCMEALDYKAEKYDPARYRIG